MHKAPLKRVRNFFQLESSGGILLILSTLAALIIVNSPLQALYEAFLKFPIGIQFGDATLKYSVAHWTQDGLMVIFFLLVGAELKREILAGELSSKEQIALPAIAALGGLVMPALIYMYFNWHDAQLLRGWAIPAATDIAFALGVILLLGKRVPDSLKVCLVALAIFDDVAAILIIAVFYTNELSVPALGLSVLTTGVLIAMNRLGVTRLTPYMLVGIILWLCVLKSGIHATIAGVILALTIPYHSVGKPLRALENNIHPWVAFAILPLFAFTNAGISFSGFSAASLTNSVTLGIMFGLLLGKPIGVMSITYLAQSLRICQLPKDVNWLQFFGMAVLTGIGFTMSLFIGVLAFETSEQLNYVRAGVISGSAIAGILGYMILNAVSKRKRH